MNRIPDVVFVVVEGYNILRLADFLAHAGIRGALLFKKRWVGPAVNHLKPFAEEDAQILSLIISTTVYRRNDAFHDLRENVQHVNLWHLHFNQHFQKSNGIKGV